MDIVTLLLRLIHILGGVFWVGAALAMNFYIGPAVGATADSGRAFMGHLVAKTSFSRIILIAAYSTVIAGAILFWQDSRGFTSAWMSSGAGIGFSVGAAFALIGLVCGILVGRNSTRLGQLGAQIQGKPTAEQLQALQAIQKQQAVVGPLNAYSLILAVVFMAVARYLVF